MNTSPPATQTLSRPITLRAKLGIALASLGVTAALFTGLLAALSRDRLEFARDPASPGVVAVEPTRESVGPPSGAGCSQPSACTSSEQSSPTRK